MPRKQSYDPDYSSVPDSPQSGNEGPIPGYFDPSIVHEFTEMYSPGNYQHCDILMTESMLRELFNAHRDQDMTFTDPWLQYKEELKSQGYRLVPNSELHESVMYLRTLEPELLTE